jgi:hypothetical protein
VALAVWMVAAHCTPVGMLQQQTAGCIKGCDSSLATAGTWD